MNNAQIAKELVLAFNRHDTSGIMTLFAEKGSFRDAILEEPLYGEDAAKYFDEVFAAFPDFNVEVLSITADDQQAVIEWNLRGTFEGEFQGMRPTGNSFLFSGASILRISGGKIVAIQEYWDSRVFMEQLGIQ